jgi:hypothetical protein
MESGIATEEVLERQRSVSNGRVARQKAIRTSSTHAAGERILARLSRALRPNWLRLSMRPLIRFP